MKKLYRIDGFGKGDMFHNDECGLIGELIFANPNDIAAGGIFTGQAHRQGKEDEFLYFAEAFLGEIT
jgi:hypothetical protein